MEKRNLLLVAFIVGLLLIGFDVFAADGDLIVNGNVGIGTAAPQDRLVIRESANVNLGLDSGIDVPGAFILNVYNDARSTNIPLEFRATKYIFDAAAGGNVGIGTTAPNSKLDVNGTVNATAYKVGGVAGLTMDIVLRCERGGYTYRFTNGILTGYTDTCASAPDRE